MFQLTVTPKAVKQKWRKRRKEGRKRHQNCYFSKTAPNLQAALNSTGVPYCPTKSKAMESTDCWNKFSNNCKEQKRLHSSEHVQLIAFRVASYNRLSVSASSTHSSNFSFSPSLAMTFFHLCLNSSLSLFFSYSCFVL